MGLVLGVDGGSKTDELGAPLPVDHAAFADPPVLGAARAALGAAGASDDAKSRLRRELHAHA